MVHSYFDTKTTQPDVDSSNSSDCENSDDRLDSIISTLFANLTVYNSEDEMTIKKYKKEKNKLEKNETEHEICDKNTNSLTNFQSSKRSATNDFPPCANKRTKSLSHSANFTNVKMNEKSNRITDSFNENSGNNSEDEYYMATGSRSHVPFQVEESEMSTLLREKKGWKITLVGTDGACLFRAVAHQIFGDEEKHMTIREQVINYMKQNREHFSQFISEDFDHYLLRKLNAYTHGNHVEIQALSELYNRPVEIYHNSLEPINVFHREYIDSPPLRLSYHGGIHYNSIVDPQNPTYGEGLGMPNYQPKLSEPELVEKAKNESEKMQLEETILQARLKRSENQEIEQSIAEQVSRESYLEYLNYLSSQRTDPVPTEPYPGVATSSSASCSYSGPRAARSSDTAPTDDTFLRHMPLAMLDMEEEDVLALVLENSRREYLARGPGARSP